MIMVSISLEEANKRNYTYPNIQTILFDLDKWSKDKAIKWLNKHEYIHKYHRLTKNQRRFMQHNPVENAEYYSKRLPNGIVLVFQYMPIQRRAEGAGIFDYFKKGIERIAPLRKEGILPPNARALLEKIKDETINSIVVVRTPIHSMISKALNVISLGKFNELVKRLGYDKLFHLSLFINGKYIFHKIEVPTLEQANPVKSNSEVMPVQITRTLNIGKFIDTTRQYMGDAKFSNYNAATNNCQVFITSALQANGLLTDKASNEIRLFINQNAEDIFKQLPQYVGKITDVITDIGARANRLIQGEGIHTYKNIKYIKPQIALAKKYKIPVVSIKLSPLKNKKYMIELKDGRIIHYGHPSYEDFLIHKDTERRARFLNRWKNNKHIDDDNSALFYSVRLLW